MLRPSVDREAYRSAKSAGPLIARFLVRTSVVRAPSNDNGKPRAACHYHSKVHGQLKFSLKIAQLTALLISLTCTLHGQQKGEASQPPFNAAPYRVGERITYNVSCSSFVSAP